MDGLMHSAPLLALGGPNPDGDALPNPVPTPLDDARRQVNNRIPLESMRDMGRLRPREVGLLDSIPEGILRLPIETLLHAMCQLSLPAVAALRRSCRDLQTIIDANANYIYRLLAIRHRFVQENKGATISFSAVAAIADRASRSGGGYWDGTEGWREFCERCFAVERSWQDGPDCRKRVIKIDHSFETFRVDSARQTIILKTIRGTLRVIDIATSHSLWRCNPRLRHAVGIAGHQQQVQHRSSPPLLLDDGYLLHLGPDASVHGLWSSKDGRQSVPMPPSAPMGGALRTPPFTRGSLYFLQSIPRITRVGALSYPLLAYISRDLPGIDAEISIHMLTSGKTILSLDVAFLGGFVDVQLNSTHLFIAGPTLIVMYEISTGSKVIEISLRQPVPGQLGGIRSFALLPCLDIGPAIHRISRVPLVPLDNPSLLSLEDEAHHGEVADASLVDTTEFDGYRRRVRAQGTHIVASGPDGLLILSMESLNDPSRMYQTATFVRTAPIRHLALSGGRACFSTDDEVYVINLDPCCGDALSTPTLYALDDCPGPAYALADLCMDDTSVYAAWGTEGAHDEEAWCPNELHVFEFAPVSRSA